MGLYFPFKYRLRSIGVWVASAFFCLLPASRLRAADDYRQYLSRISVNPGDTIDIFASSGTPHNRTIRVYDVEGKVLAQIAAKITTQTIESTQPWKDGFGYAKTSQFQVPENYASGYYYIGADRFIVRRPSKVSDIVIVHPTNTINAYSKSGGKNIYDGPDTVSFLRPQQNYDGTYAFDTWMTHQDYDYRYLADSDLQHYDQISGSKLLVITGGNEYWTREARENFDRYINEGGNVLVISGNTMNRPIKYDNDDNPTQMTELRPHAPNKGLWMDPSFNYPVIDSIGADWYWGGYGSKTDFGWDGWKIVDDSVPYLQGTNLKNGDVLSMYTNEYDGPPMLGYDPTTGVPIVDTERLGNYSFKLIGYDRALSNWRGTDGWGAWYEFQRTPTSGRVIVVGSTHWTSNYDPRAHEITANMFDYLLATATGTVVGDFDADGHFTAADIDAITHAINEQSLDRKFDVDHDGQLTEHDRDAWIHFIKKTHFGDTNLDGVFNSTDLVAAMTVGGYENQIVGDAVWSGGDWNGDGDFDSSDLVAAFSDGSYASTSSPAAVPETMTPCVALWIVGLVSARLVQRRS